MKIPSPLRPGSTIGLIAPCSPLPANRVLQCAKTITDLGFRAVLGDSTMKNKYGYLAGSDYYRAADINQMFSDDSIDAIFCLRGGYGSTRIMDLLDYQTISCHPKIFVGYSDVTTFHLAFYSFCDMMTFHGPMVSSNMVDNFDSYTRNSFFKALCIPDKYEFENPPDKPLTTIVSGCTSGRLTGGCLSLVSPSIGTFYQPDFTDTILFLEEIEETVPRCDKMMQHLKNSGILSQVNGVILGNFKDCKNPNDLSYTIDDFFQDFFKGYEKPVLSGLQSGHEKPMGTLPLGSVCTLNASQKKIVFEFR